MLRLLKLINQEKLIRGPKVLSFQSDSLRAITLATGKKSLNMTYNMSEIVADLFPPFSRLEFSL